jgi:hypothetical protein
MTAKMIDISNDNSILGDNLKVVAKLGLRNYYGQLKLVKAVDGKHYLALEDHSSEGAVEVSSMLAFLIKKEFNNAHLQSDGENKSD